LALSTAIKVWALSSTSGTTRWREELIAKKHKVVDSLFVKVGRNPAELTALDVQGWCGRMQHDERSTVPEALDHGHIGTTRAYVQTIAVKKDKFKGQVQRQYQKQNRLISESLCLTITTC
jgi:hypothetical protein